MAGSTASSHHAPPTAGSFEDVGDVLAAVADEVHACTERYITLQVGIRSLCLCRLVTGAVRMDMVCPLQP